MERVEKEVTHAVHWWVAERHGKVNEDVYSVMPFIFQTLDALYVVTRKFPKEWPDGRIGVRCFGKNNFYIQIPLNSDQYIDFRAALSLVGDIYNLLQALKTTGNLMELSSPIDNLYHAADEFRELRNFYTHIDDRIVKLEKHGVNGESETGCGITYEKGAKDNFHLVFSHSSVYFSNYKRSQRKEINRSSFDNIFKHARDIYSIITDHSIHESIYRNAGEVYPLS